MLTYFGFIFGYCTGNIRQGTLITLCKFSKSECSLMVKYSHDIRLLKKLKSGLFKQAEAFVAAGLTQSLHK